jgi:hypothetical protein
LEGLFFETFRGTVVNITDIRRKPREMPSLKRKRERGKRPSGSLGKRSGCDDTTKPEGVFLLCINVHQVPPFLGSREIGGIIAPNTNGIDADWCGSSAALRVSTC